MIRRPPRSPHFPYTPLFRSLTRADDDPVAELMRRWAGPDWTATAGFAEAVSRYRSAARIPQAAYGSMEYFRWAGRSQLRPDGLDRKSTRLNSSHANISYAVF